MATDDPAYGEAAEEYDAATYGDNWADDFDQPINTLLGGRRRNNIDWGRYSPDSPFYDPGYAEEAQYQAIAQQFAPPPTLGDLLQKRYDEATKDIPGAVGRAVTAPVRAAGTAYDVVTNPTGIVDNITTGLDQFFKGPNSAENFMNLMGFKGVASAVKPFGEAQAQVYAEEEIQKLGFESVADARAKGFDDVADRAVNWGLDELSRTSAIPADINDGGAGVPDVRRNQNFRTPAPIGPPSDPLADLLATITGNTVNPFGDTEEGNLEFSNVIQSGIDRLFSDLGPNPNEQLVDATFNRPNVGDIILGQERGIRQGGFRDVLGEAFPGKAFGDIDDDIINSIVEERAGGQRNVFAGQQARGNFSPAGVLAANEDLLSQTPGATERVREVGQNVVQGSQGDIDALRDIGTQRVQDFTLGQPDIDFSDLISQREGLIGERQGSLGSDISGALGSEPLFDINRALLTGGRSQGVVSGERPNTLLDTIAERERRGTSTTDRRGLGTRGSGAF